VPIGHGYGQRDGHRHACGYTDTDLDPDRHRDRVADDHSRDRHRGLEERLA
jgi:hypothetical protein